MLLCAEDDVVVVPELPSPAWLRSLPFPIPQFVTSVDQVGDRPIASVEPWGPSPTVGTWRPEWRDLYSKAWATELLARFPADPRLVPAGAVCTSVAEVERATRGDGPWVVKAPFSTAGRDRQRAKGPWHLDLAWVERVIAAQGAVVVEPWLDRIADLSIQATAASGSAVVDGLVRIHNDDRGRFVGAVVGPVALGLAPALRPALLADRWLDRLAARVAGHVAAAAPTFSGPFGVDVLVARDGRVKPIVEVNPRVTMGRLALALRPFVARAGFWHHVTQTDARRLGFADLAAFAAALPPPVLDGHRLAAGALCTTEARRDTRVLTVVSLPHNV
jgi:hypothetical protein